VPPPEVRVSGRWAREPHELILRVPDVLTGLSSVSTRCTSTPARGSSPHTIKAECFIVFKFDGHIMLTIKVFNETMCRSCYHSDEDN
jgi:hypothetical protein